MHKQPHVRFSWSLGPCGSGAVLTRWGWSLPLGHQPQRRCLVPLLAVAATAVAVCPAGHCSLSILHPARSPCATCWVQVLAPSVGRAEQGSGRHSGQHGFQPRRSPGCSLVTLRQPLGTGALAGTSSSAVQLGQQGGKEATPGWSRLVAGRGPGGRVCFLVLYLLF